MKVKKPFTLAFHYLDNDQLFKISFSRKCLALDYFYDFRQQNKRPVTVTLYNTVSPCWIYSSYDV